MTSPVNIDTEWEETCRALHQLAKEQEEQQAKLNQVRHKYKGATICYSDERAEEAEQRMKREEKRLEKINYVLQKIEEHFNLLLAIKTGKCKLYESNAGN